MNDNLPKDIEITRVLKKFNLGELKSVTKLSGGLINPAFLINNKYVLRLESQKYEPNPDKLKKEAFLFSILPKFGIPTPKLIGFDDSQEILTCPYLLLEYIPGDSLANSYANFTSTQQQQVAHEFGQLAKKIHSITPADLNDHAILGNADQWLQKNTHYFTKYWQIVKTSPHLSDAVKSAIEHHWDLFTNLNLKNFGRLIHGDFSAGNIQIEDGHIVGIFDFEYSFFADPFWDLQKLPVSFQLKPAFNNQTFLEGYGVSHFSNEAKIRVKMYCYHQGVWEIWATITQFMPFGAKELAEGQQLITNTTNYDLLY